MNVTVLLGVACVLIWLYLLLGRGRFWRISVQPAQPSGPRKVIAIVPARNEADVVSRALAALLKQSDVDLSVILVDDHSRDFTSEIAYETVGAMQRMESLTVIKAPPLPAGWSGKLWALQQGIEEAQKHLADFYLLTDADIEHSPPNVSSLVSIAETGHYDLASYMVKLHCQMVPERLLIPPFVYFFFQLYPPAWVSSSQMQTAGAAGGCLLIRPEALQRAGAMNSIRGEIIDDCALARAVKQSGGSVWLGVTESAASIRPYRSFKEIERMIARTAFNQLRHSIPLLVVAIVGLLLTYIAPVALLVGRYPWFGVVACALMLLSYLPIIRFYRLNPLWTLTLPIAAMFYMASTLDSAIRYWSGTGGEWKGRAQDQPPPGARP
jgi:hopene-associated glycosyltransferase HpnB